MVELRTARLMLRPCRPEDRDDLIALELDPEVMRFLNGGPVNHDHTHPEDVTFLMPRGTEPDVWVAQELHSLAFVGWFGLFEDSSEQAEIGYRLRRNVWGQGLAPEGAGALIGWGFDIVGYDRIVASTMAVNLASRRVMEKLGMRHTRTDFSEWSDPIPGSDHGEVWYEVTRASWCKRATA